MPDLAYVARGKLFVRLGDEEPREVESAFAAKVATRTASMARKNAWKSQGRGARFMMGLGGAMPEDALEAEPTGTPVRYTGLSRGRFPAELLYSLSTGPVSGVFVFSEGHEDRLFHGADHEVVTPVVRADGDMIACSARFKDGRYHIAVMKGDGSDLTQLTEGDAMDTHPAWGSAPNRIIYASSGLGYDATGRVVDVSPSTIHELDIEKGETRCIAEAKDAELGLPRVGKDGTLYYVRRPRAKLAPFSFFQALVDIVSFPWRMLWAIVQYFNFFSIRYTGKPLLSAGTKKQRHADMRQLYVMGNMVNAAQDAKDDDDGALPATWELVARRPDGTERVAARRVLAYDVADDGSIVYSNGKAVFHVAPGGAETKLVAEDAVTDVLALPA